MARQRAQPNTTDAVPKLPTQLRLTRKRALDEVESSNSDRRESAVLSASKRARGDDGDMMKQFRDRIATDQRELRLLLHERSRQTEQQNKRRRDDVISTLEQALHAPAQTPSSVSSKTSRNRKFDTNPLFTSACKLNDSCQSLLSRYHTFEGKIMQMASEQKTSVMDVWARDMKETEKLLILGHKKAVRDVKKVLGVGTEGIEGEDSNVNGFQRDESRDSDLHKSLRYVERGVRRMVKGLPVSEVDGVD